MIPPIFARAVERDICALGVCADYLEDQGIDGSILRIIANNHFLLDDSGFCDSFLYYGTGSGANCPGGGEYGYTVIGSGVGSGVGSGYSLSLTGDGFGYDHYYRGHGCGFGYGDFYGNGRRSVW